MPNVDDLVRARAKVVAVAGCVLGLAATFASQGLLLRLNRVHRGDPASLFEALGSWGWVVLAAWVIAIALSVSGLPERVRGATVMSIGAIVPIAIVWRSGVAASGWVAETGDIARTSFGWGFWLLMLAAYVVIFASSAWVRPGWGRASLALLPFAGIALLMMTGALSELGIAREYANNQQTFWREFRLHLSYVAGAVGVGLTIGFALGLLAARKRGTESAVFGILNVLQVLPTLAFIGLMNPVLSALSNRFEVFARLGVRGVGWAPVIVVLSAYAIYPIARNTHAAVVSLDREIVDAARGVGMGRLRLLADIELPLSLPIIFAGLRIALVQSTAGAIIAGLVGGGGLGTFVFLGAAETANDLILLGTLPIVGLALFFDRTVLALQKATGSWSAVT